ncbi:MAG: hypothetical protein JWQ18_3715, partial [Conexibacter sp.]|nr:hypothetical protein [Conexibacter sp.]
MRGSTLIVVAALSLGASAAPASASAADAPACAHAGEQATALSIAQTRSAI